MEIRDILDIDEKKCTGCGKCVPKCAEGAIKIVDNIAKLIAEKFCDGLGDCIDHCPEGALKIVRRKADEYLEVAIRSC